MQETEGKLRGRNFPFALMDATVGFEPVNQYKVRQSNSLRSKRFCRVWEQRKTEERGLRYFACAENGPRPTRGKEKRRLKFRLGKWGESQKKNGGGRGGEGRKRLRTNP